MKKQRNDTSKKRGKRIMYDSSYCRLAERMSKLYVNYKRNYIEQIDSGSYITKTDGSTYLGLGFIASHLAGDRTFGIRDEKAAKVIVFDIDENDQAVAKQIIRILSDFGFPENSIQLSLSGRKGYHVTCYFAKAIAIQQLNQLQNCVMVELYDAMPDAKKVNIDLRPTQGYGVKLPLGIHRVTNARCWFCDKESFMPIDSFEHIFSIEQIPRSFYDGTIMKNLKRRNNQTGLMLRAKKLKNRNSYESSGKEQLEKSIESIMSERLKCIHTRHSALLSMCTRLCYLGIEEERSRTLLVAWMQSQDPRTYTTPIRECIADIDRIIKYIYSSRFKCIESAKDSDLIPLTYKEVKFLLSFEQRSMWKLVLFLVLTHKSNDSFDLQWRSQSSSMVANATGLSRNTVAKYITTLCEMGYIEKNTGRLSSDSNSGKTTVVHVSNDFYANRYGNIVSEIRVTPKLVNDILAMPSGKIPICFVNRTGMMSDIIRDALTQLDIRDELKQELSRYRFESLYGDYKSA